LEFPSSIRDVRGQTLLAHGVLDYARKTPPLRITIWEEELLLKRGSRRRKRQTPYRPELAERFQIFSVMPFKTIISEKRGGEG